MKALPLRWKITIYTAGLTGVVLAIFGTGVALHLYDDGIAELDKELSLVARGFFAEIEGDGSGVNWTNRRTVTQLFPAIRHLYFVEVKRGSETLFRSQNLRAEQFPPMAGRRVFANGELRGQPVRVGQFEDAGHTLRLGVDKYYVEETRDDLMIAYLCAGPALLLLVAAGGWWIAGRALAPVRRVAAAAELITARRLDQRLPVPGSGDEIAELARVLNRMIDRLEASFLQATRFSADASHELKTPLTILRGEIEQALREPALSEGQESLLANLLEETQRLTEITEALLLLSRADAGRLELELEPLDLPALLGEILEDVEILAAPRGITIDAQVPGDATVRGNAQFLRQVLLNLFDNAIKYNEAGGAIRVRVECADSRVTICVANTGPGLTAEQGARVFDRFYRAEPSRNSATTGHGLGLSICREIARAHDGELTIVAPGEPGWTEFRVTLPMAPNESPRHAALPAGLSVETARTG
jgi:heavy metal sensor kinase